MNQFQPEEFRARAEELGRWMRQAGGLPTRSSEDEHERKLFVWRKRPLMLSRTGALSPECEANLDALAPGWRPTCLKGGEGFQARAEGLGRWMRSEGRPPASSSDDTRERRLAAWRNAQQRRLRAGTLSPERQNYLAAVAPGWSLPRRMPDKYRDLADELGRWMTSASRVPTRDSADAQERRLADWRYRQLKQARDGTLPPERQRYLDTVAPEWHLMHGKEVFHAQADELGRWFTSADGALPPHNSDDPHLQRLSAWRHRQLARLRDKTLPAEREQYLDMVAPGWRPRQPAGIEEFQLRADDLGRWLSGAGTIPSCYSDDQHERQLGRWRQAQLGYLRAGRLAPEREHYLEQVAPAWRTGTDSTFRAKAVELGQWMRSAGRLPSCSSADAQERRIGYWRSTQMRGLCEGRLSPERQACLDLVAPGWRPTPRLKLEEFRTKARALGRWMRSAGRVPDALGADAHERQLARWRYAQTRHLGAGTLSPECEKHLDAEAPGWRPRVQDVEFPARARALGRWLPSADGKVPNGSSDDQYERRLNRWRRRWLVQLRTGTLPSEHERYLDKVAPGWRPRARSGVDDFPARAQALGRWLASSDRLPSQRGDDLHERRLREWRLGWLFHLRNGTLLPERERYLDEVAPGWRPRRTISDRTNLPLA